MIKRVVIVGGGTSGWMTAAYLRMALPQLESITVVESSRIATIGVGEATFSTAKLFFDYLGLLEHQWMPSCNAAYKLAIRFVDWAASPGYFYHPFERYGLADGFNLGEWWLKLRRDAEPFDQSCFVTPALCDTLRSPRRLDGTVWDEGLTQYFGAEHVSKRNMMMDHRIQFPYGYHFDAALLARFLMRFAMDRGVRRVVDNVVGVGRTEDGGISHVKTEEHGEVAGDLFVDCTGFSGLLLNQMLDEPFVSFSKQLLCDRAVALQVPVDVKAQGMRPYTTATAKGAGWIWEIPLYGRLGTGYVYSSAFLSKEDAEDELRRHLGPAARDCQPNHIKMRIGRSRRSWVKNCVAIGLSSGFVEPLESTGIFFIQHGIEELVSHFPAGGIDDAMVASYNRAVADTIDGVRDFLTLHYACAGREDNDFWKATKHGLVLPDALRESLTLWRRRLPNAKNIPRAYHGFEAYSYSAMLLGLGYRPETSLPALDYTDASRAEAAFRAVRERGRHLVETLPSQYEYLTAMRAMPDAAAPASDYGIDRV
jgi:tryptophan halogenase